MAPPQRDRKAPFSRRNAGSRDALAILLERESFTHASEAQRNVRLGKISNLLRSGDPFECLELNPFHLLGERQTSLDASGMIKICSHLFSFSTFGDLVNWHDTAAKADIVTVVRSKLHYIHHWTRARQNPQLVAELATCPLIYDILIKLWVDQDISKTMGPGEWTKDFHSTLVRALCLATTDWKPTGRPPVPDNHSVACFTSLPGLKPRQFIRRALHIVQALLNGGFDELIKTTYLNVIFLFANSVFSIRRPPRDAIRCIVDILRGILDQPCSHALASVAFSILLGMWLADETGRSVAWSVRDGVVLVLHSLHRKRPDKIWVEALWYIAARATHIPVIRALCAAGDLWLDGEETSSDVLRIRGCIEGHCVVYESYPVPSCENERCPRDGTTPPLRKHRSACCSIPYCSIDCQREAWPRHKARCPARNHLTTSEGACLWYGKSSWSSLRFAIFCAHNILGTHMRRILQLKPELDGPGPRTSTSVPRYFLTIDMTTVPPTCKVSVTFPEHPEVTEAKVEFYAQVYAVGGTEQQLIHVLDAPLPMLKAAAHHTPEK
ncbi:hypothetical protein GGF50DRAFT_117887 [Schizophyllum commune]